MLIVDHYVSESSQMFNEFIMLRIRLAIITYVQILCGHVTHAGKASGTKTHRQHAKVTLDAAFVIGVVATADRTLMSVYYCFLPGHVLLNKLNSRSFIMILASKRSTLR